MVSAVQDTPAALGRRKITPRRLRAALIVVGVSSLAIVGAGWWTVRRALGPIVATVRARRVELVQSIVASGRVASAGEVSVGTVLGGVVRTLHAREGDRVTAGQLLVELEDGELSAQVAQARAGVLVASARVAQLRVVTARVARANAAQAESNLRASRSTWVRQSTLAGSGAISEAELEAAQRSLDVARSQLDVAQYNAAASVTGGGDALVAVASRVQAEAALRLAEARLDQTRVRSPVAGVISRRNVEAGDVVAPGRALLVLLRDGPTELWLSPDERSLAELRLGQRAIASAEAFATQPFSGTLNYIAPTIDPLRGVVEARVLVLDPPAFLKPSMTVSVEIEVARRPRALSIDANVVRDAATSAPWVLVLDPSGRAVRRAVRLGVRGARRVEIVSGIDEGASVIAVTAAVVEGQRARAAPASSDDELKGKRANELDKVGSIDRTQGERDARCGPRAEGSCRSRGF
ncbi:MAG: efflux RND transporter periplasmic adaptor subunit [Myxococcales bacterium]|nr:efflux RND transporter periplasmic adaptor subunit [Myxococcales bacterium]